MLIPLGILASVGGVVPPIVSDYELIESTVLTSAQSSVTFSSLATYASTYKHLQLRAVGKDTDTAAAQRNAVMRFNADTTSYYSHALVGTGSSVIAEAIDASVQGYPFIYYSGGLANIFGAAVIDILDAFSTTKNKTVRSLAGVAVAGASVRLHSFAYFDTQAIGSIEFFPTGSQWAIGSRFSLYGVK